jgi:ubiquinone/menaquinone biosynthesis C-methylase UbiE
MAKAAAANNPSNQIGQHGVAVLGRGSFDEWRASMKANTGWQISGNSAEFYERSNVPTIFAPWARHLLERARLEEGNHVLDVACGTGIASRFAKNQVGESGRVVGVDLNPGMLAVARSTALAQNLDIELMQSDAAQIPLAEAEFDVAFCQQGFQFFPDKVGALKEIHRLLKPSGRCIICVAREMDLLPNVKSQFDAVTKHISPDAARAFAAVSSLSSRSEIEQLFRDASFREIEIQSVVLMVENEDGAGYVRGTLLASPIGQTILEWTEEAREALATDVLKGYGDCFDGQRLKFPHVSHVVVASKS